MEEEKRRVQITGGSTFIISLPLKWAKRAGIKQGDELTLIPRDDNSLLILVRKGKNGGISSTTFELSEEESLEENFRYLIAYYLVGYDVIRLVSASGFNAETRKWIKEEVRKRLIGMEVVEESSKEIVLQSFLKYEDFPLQEAIRSMSKIVVSMQEDAIASLEEHNKELAKDVIERENEIDRFYLLIVRQLKAAMRDYELAKKIGIHRQRDSLGYRIIVKSIERIGDHAEGIARNSLRMHEEVAKNLSGIKELGYRSKEVFTKTLDSLLNMDIKGANETIKEAEKLIDMEVELSEKILAEEMNINDKIYALSILESLGRIAKYCEDIAEVTINMGIKEGSL
ncbi:MAG: PhoU domain-containing protein [Candidatus Methanospirareceae archaeon]